MSLAAAMAVAAMMEDSKVPPSQPFGAAAFQLSKDKSEWLACNVDASSGSLQGQLIENINCYTERR